MGRSWGRVVRALWWWGSPCSRFPWGWPYLFGDCRLFGGGAGSSGVYSVRRWVRPVWAMLDRMGDPMWWCGWSCPCCLWWGPAAAFCPPSSCCWFGVVIPPCPGCLEVMSLCVSGSELGGCGVEAPGFHLPVLPISFLHGLTRCTWGLLGGLWWCEVCSLWFWWCAVGGGGLLCVPQAYTGALQPHESFDIWPTMVFVFSGSPKRW